MDPDEIGFKVEVDGRPEGAVVKPRGELDVATQAELRGVLARETANGAVTLDLSALGFIDTSGLRLILENAEAARRGEIEFLVIPGSPPVQRLFEVAGVTELVPWRDDREGGAS